MTSESADALVSSCLGVVVRNEGADQPDGTDQPDNPDSGDSSDSGNNSDSADRPSNPDGPGDSGSDRPGGFANPFTDVFEASTDHYAHIMWLAESGVAAGFENLDGTFRYEFYSTAKRCDMAVMPHRLDGLEEGYEVA